MIAPNPLPRLFSEVGRGSSVLVFDQKHLSSVTRTHHCTGISLFSFETKTTMDSIDPINDPRVSHCYAQLNGSNYHYLLGVPSAGYKATIFLVHGWPDLSIGWRNQIPMLLGQGYRVVCPDLMGFGRTDAPQINQASDMAYYSFKRAADDIMELAKQLGCETIILGGHDWGGAIAYRTALWHPKLVSRLFAVCTPYWPPSKTYTPLETMVRTRMPNWGYQLHLASGEVEERIKSKAQIEQFLNSVYGGQGPDGEAGFSHTEGPLYENLPRLNRTPLVGKELLEFYAAEYERHGMRGTLCWYRNREQNFQDELQLEKKTVDIPVLFIQATNDAALPPSLSDGMERFVPDLTRKEVEASHWALWQKPVEVNGMVREWLERAEETKSHL